MKIQPTPLGIIGAGGFGREVLDLVKDINGVAPTLDFLGFLDDGDVNAPLLERLGATLLGSSSRLADLAATYVIAIGAAEPRRRIDALARSTVRSATTRSSRTTPRYTGLRLGGGCVIEEGATLGTGCVIRLGARVDRGDVGAGAAVVRDVAPEATVAGTVERPALPS